MRNHAKHWIVSFFLFYTTCIFAGEAPSRPPIATGWQYDLGVGLIANPEFQGSDDYRVLPVPYFDVRFVDAKGTKTFFNVPQGFGTYLLRERFDNGNRIALSAAVAPGFQNRDADDIAGLETFGVGVEARLGAEFESGPWSLQAGIAQAVASGHEGLYANLTASYRFNLGGGMFAGIGPSLRFGNTNYMSALYGVTPSESLASGLAAFDAESGLESAAVQGILSFPVGSNWRFTGVARMGELVGDAGDSSLTLEQSQFFVVAAITRRF